MEIEDVINIICNTEEFDFRLRGESTHFLYNQGMTYEDMEDILRSLSAHHLHKGPVEDYDDRYPGDIWVFKKDHIEVRIYIKLKVNCENEVKILSFHEWY